MKFTREQFDEMGKFYIDDLAINDRDQTLMFEIFNRLPRQMQGLAVQWGFDDSCFRDDVFVYLLVKLFGMTVKQYYASDIMKAFKDHDTLQPVDLSKII